MDALNGLDSIANLDEVVESAILEPIPESEHV